MAVIIGSSSFGSTSIEDVVSGAADFGVTGADEFLVAWSSGADVRALTVICQRRQLVAMTLKGSRIAEPRDLVGKTFGAPGDESGLIIRSMLASRGIDYGSDMAVVLMGGGF